MNNLHIRNVYSIIYILIYLTYFLGTKGLIQYTSGKENYRNILEKQNKNIRNEMSHYTSFKGKNKAPTDRCKLICFILISVIYEGQKEKKNINKIIYDEIDRFFFILVWIIRFLIVVRTIK